MAAADPTDQLPDTGDLLAAHEAAGGADPAPGAPVTDLGDPNYVEPYLEAQPVGPSPDAG